MTRTDYYAARRAIRVHHVASRIEMKACELADSPMWAAREEGYRQRARHEMLIARLPKSKPCAVAALLAFQSLRRALVNKQIAARKSAERQAERDRMTRMPGECVLDFIDRKCGYVRDTQLWSAA